MRVVQKQQLQLGELAIAEIDIDLKYHDDIPKIMLGLRYLYTKKKEELLEILEKYFYPHRNHAVGRPGMDIWRIMVLDILKQGLGCDFDRIQLFANRLPEVRTMLGHTGFADITYCKLETMIGNMNLLSEELLG